MTDILGILVTNILSAHIGDRPNDGYTRDNA